MKWGKRLGAVASGLALLAGCWLYALGSGWLGAVERAGQAVQRPVPAPHLAQRTIRSHETQARLTKADEKTAPAKQILFGDLHVHTTFSFDAFLLGLPMLGGEGSHPPADACDFARYCSELDFWSINDHAEYLTPDLWQQTIESVRQCNAIAEDPDNPDLVTFLGWEWSQSGTTPDKHYGHKNVVLLGTGEDEIPTRPIASTHPGFAAEGGPFPAGTPTVLALLNGQRGRDFARYLASSMAVEPCPDGVPVRELPKDCREFAATPEALFAKLDDWGHESLVIPHGTTWGIYTPATSSWDKQLAGHDPERQALVEVYSGHGNSEEYRSWRPVETDAAGADVCPSPGPDYNPSCWRSGELIRERCLAVGETAEECDARAAVARKHYVEAGNGGWMTAPGNAPDRWLDSGQCRDCFQPAFNYRPLGSAQYMMAVRNFDDPENPKRYRFGFMASSDIHTAKPGSGYKEFWRGEMTEGRGTDPDMRLPEFMIPAVGEAAPESTPFDLATEEIRGMSFFENERVNSFFYTGGLVAVHANGRDRNAIFSGLKRKEVYGTSGPRILLWFDLLEATGAVLPMGSSTRRRAAPRFRVRAAGSFVQKDGCPRVASNNLGAQRLEALCRGECYFPSDTRRRIERIEIIRIRPQNEPGEPLDDLIEDPWKTHECAPHPDGCVFEFEDSEFAASRRDALYYARAIEETSTAIHGNNPLGCTYDRQGHCIEVEPCGVRVPRSNDCLSQTQQRAWSSPIFVDFANGTEAP